MAELSSKRLFGPEVIDSTSSNGFTVVTTPKGSCCFADVLSTKAYVCGLNDGADIELEACAEQLNAFNYSHLALPLRRARRSKPLTTRQKAEKALDSAMKEAGKGGRIFEGAPFYELQELIKELPDA